MVKHSATPKKVRITILTNEEIDELYLLPIFSHIHREEYFALDDETLKVIANLERLETKVYLILLIGYFRAKPVIPKFQLMDVYNDVRYICQKYFDGKDITNIYTSKSTRSTLVTKMLSIVGAERYQKSAHQHELVERPKDVVTISTEPRYIFDECLAFFGQKNIALAGYTTLQDLITDTLAIERQRTELILSQKMTDLTKQRLKNILAKTGELSKLSGYRGSARDFSPSDINRELETHETIRVIYPELKVLITNLSLSQGNLSYYASIVKHHSLYKLRRYPEWQGLLYLAVYLYHRYQESNDKLVTAFSYLVRKHSEAAKLSARLRIANELEKVRNKLKYAGNILNFFVDDELSDDINFGEVRERAFSLLSTEEIKMVSQHLGNNDFDQSGYEWLYTDKQQRQIANSMRKLFIAIDIQCEYDQPAMATQIEKAKQELKKNGSISSIDQRIILKNDLRHIVQGDDVHTKRFEYYLYYRVYKLLDADKIFVTESESNKRLDDDLIDHHEWDENKHTILEKTGLERLQNPINQTLTELKERYQWLLTQVTNSINENTNDFVKKLPKSNQLAWSLANKRWKDDVDNPIYRQVQHMGIIEIMQFVNQKTNYLSAFTNVSSRKRSLKADNDDLIACLFGNAANYGANQFASTSDRSLGSLRSVNDNYVRLETTSPSNDMISDAIAGLPIFRHYIINEAAPFSSIDGQKFACRFKTFKARFSSKYFRKGKGVSALTLVSNHVPVNSTVISPNEYEAHFAFDLLYNNESVIKTKSLATDTHVLITLTSLSWIFSVTNLRLVTPNSRMSLKIYLI